MSIELTALKDSHISKGHPTTNHGSDISLEVNDDGIIAWGTQRGLISFDLSSIPASATLISATLVSKFSGKSGSPTGKKLYLYKMIRPTWVEAEATWNEYSSGNNWTSAGGDFVTSDPDPAEVTIPSDWSDFEWDILALVQDALDNSIDLHLILRIEDDLGTDGDMITTYSSEHPTQPGPVLTVNYTATPTVTTDPATSVEQTTVTLNGTLDDEGSEACDCSFEYGETTDYGTTTATQSKETDDTFEQEVRGLKSGTVYHFRAKATNSDGTSYGADRTFHTEALSAEAHQALGKGYALGRRGP